MKNSVSKYRKHAGIFIAAVIAFALCLAAGFSLFAHAESALPFDESIQYFYVQSPSALYAEGDSVYVSADNRVYHFNRTGQLTGQQALAGVKALTGGGGLLYALAGNSVLSSGTDTLAFSPVADTALALLQGTLTDLAYADGILYIAAGDKIYSYSPGTVTAKTAAGTVQGLTSDGTDVYYYVATGEDSACYRLSGSGAGEAYKENIEMPITQAAVSSIKTNGRSLLYFLMDAHIYYFERDFEGKDKALCFTDSESNNINNVVRFCVSGSDIYYITRTGTLYRVNEGDHKKQVLFASNSNEPGFFRSVSGIEARQGMVYAADKKNDRVAVYGKTALEKYIMLKSPVAVAADDEGALYIAYNGNHIAKYDRFYEPAGESAVVGITLTALASDSDGSLYILADNNLYRKKGLANDVLDALASAVDHFTFDRFSGLLFLVRGGSVFSFDPLTKNETALFTYPAGIRAMTLDAKGNYYLLLNRLDTSDVVRVAADGNVAAAVTFSMDNVSEACTALAISPAANAFCGEGDLLIADDGRLRIVKLEAAAVGTALLSADDADLTGEDAFIIRTAVKRSYLYAAPSEAEIITAIDAGAHLIVPKYDIGIKPYCYVLYSDDAAKTLTGGFIYRSSLSDPLPYAVPELSSTAYVFFDDTPLYRYPSSYAQKVIEAAPKDTKLSLMAFADYDPDGQRWYRAQAGDGTVGYVAASAVSLRNFLPGETEMPQTNAAVIAKNGVKEGIFLYRYHNNRYEIIEDSPLLKIGTRVEIVNAYDNTKRFTLIRYYDETVQQTAECYVETVYLKYDGVSFMQVIAFVVMTLCMILLAVAVIRWSVYRRNNNRPLV